MDLLSLCPYPAAPLVWQLTPSRWVLTVVCKATYTLTPGVVGPSAEQEPIQDEDAHWDDDPGRSLFAPADLVPFKPRADVMLVGCAYARNGQPARSLVVRLNVGKIDKSIEVLCPRVRTRDGELREGKRWTKMPLLYERAAGGPRTDNPVGIHNDSVRDPYGQLALPNLQAPGLSLPQDKLPPPIGFGPIAGDWPARRGRVPRGSGDRDWARAPYGEGFDPAYFQAAPPDQQLDALRPTERIALENLLAKHPVFVSSLPGDRVRARIELRGASPREVSLVPDSLWIDTDRAICSVTFRAKVDIEHPDQEGRILVALAKNDQPIAWSRIAPAPPPPSSQTSSTSQTSHSSPPPGLVAPIAATPAPGRAASPPVAAAPPAPPAPSAPPAPPARVSSAPAPTSPPPVPAARPSAAPAKVPPPPRRDDAPAARTPSAPPRFDAPPLPAPPRVELTPPADADIDMVESVEVTMTEALGPGLDQTAALRPITAQPQAVIADTTALPFQPAPPGWKPPAAVPSRPGFAPLPGVPHDLTVTPSFGMPAARGTLPDWGDPPSAPPPVPPPPPPASAHPSTPPVPPPPLVSSPAWNALSPSRVTAPALLGAPPRDAPLGALEASNAAAGVGAGADSAPPRNDAESAAPAPAPASPGVVVELLWFDPAAAQRFAQHPLFAAAKRPVAPRPAEGATGAKDPATGTKADAAGAAPRAEPPPADPANEGDLARTWVYDVVTRSAPVALGALESVLDTAEEESPPAAALAVVTGTLELGLDEVEMLRAVAAAATPLAASDKKLKEAIDLANEMLKSPMQGMPDFAESLGARIRDAWTKANRALPPEHLATSTERLLLEQRAYQRRELLDDTWIRARLEGEAGAGLPVYLPARIAKRLPLFRRFPARLLVEIVWPQDQYETASLALRTLALGRLPARSRQGSPKGRRRPA